MVIMCRAVIVEAEAEVEGDEGKEFVLLETSFNFWKREYPHFKIYWPTEDIYVLFCI